LKPIGRPIFINLYDGMAFLVAFVGKRSKGLEREKKDGDVT
jgi:hypothetical protein